MLNLQTRSSHTSQSTKATTPRWRFMKMSSEDLKKLDRRMQEKFRRKTRPFQFGGSQAQLEGVDVIIQAATGAGKTTVVAGPHSMVKGMCTIFVSPLLQLQDEMVVTFGQDFGLRAVAINSKNEGVSTAVVKAILEGKYQVIITSPEMLLGEAFRDCLLRNPHFIVRVLAMVIDEAHCISHWGADFRKQYSSLYVARMYFARGTPVVALSATLTARVRRDVQSKLHFPKSGSLFINTGNDRPNVSIVVRPCHNAMNTYSDLAFVLPTSIPSPTAIPKTWIYVNNISAGNDIIDYLGELLLQRLAPGAHRTVHRGLFRPFNASMSHEYRELAMEAFRRGIIRVMVCTDAAGMGCNVPDIKFIIVWKAPDTMSHFVQRAGRAARGAGFQGVAILLAERSLYSRDLCSSDTGKRGVKRAHDGRKSTSQIALEKAYAVAHGVERGGVDKLDTPPSGQQPTLDELAEDEGLGVFVQSVHCRRQVWASIFDNDPDSLAPLTDGTLCCDICAPQLLDLSRPAPPLPSARRKAPRRGKIDITARVKIIAWRERVFHRDLGRTLLAPSAVLEDAHVDLLASIGNVRHDVLAQLLEDKWIFWYRYSTELKSLLATTDVRFVAIPKKTRKKTSQYATQPSHQPGITDSARETGSSPLHQDTITPESSCAYPAHSPLPSQPFSSQVTGFVHYSASPGGAGLAEVRDMELHSTAVHSIE